MAFDIMKSFEAEHCKGNPRSIFPKVGFGAEDHREDAIQYVPGLSGDLVMGLSIRSSSPFCISRMSGAI